MLDLPVAERGDADPDERYRRAARAYAGWRGDGTLRKDPRPSLYVYEQAYAVPGSAVRRVQRGFYGRLRLEPFGDGVRPHERTLAGPREDRHKLMRATGANLSGVVGLYADASGTVAKVLADVAAEGPAAEVTDGDGVRHRLWVVPDDGPTSAAVAALREAAGRGPITIADGHHRYETALRYRDERRRTSANEEDPAHDYVLMLFLETTAQPLTVLPTHRVARGLGEAASGLVSSAASLFDVEPVADGGTLAEAFGPGRDNPGGRGRYRALDADRRRRSRRPSRGVRPVPAGRGRRRSAASTSRSSPSRLSGWAGSTGRRRRPAGGSRTRSPRRRRSGGSTPRRTAPMRHSSSSRRPSRRSPPWPPTVT